MTAIPVAHPASAQGLNNIVRDLNNTINPNDIQRREDQAERVVGGGHYRRGDRPTSESRESNRHGDRPTSESRGHNGDGGDRRNYGDRRDNAEGRQPTFSYR